MALGLLGIIRLALLLPAFHFILRLVGKQLSDIGLSVPANWRKDAALGAAVGVIWPALQFLVFIPLTGGLSREDVVASRALIGDEPIGLLGVIILSWTLAAVGEEVFFRGHIIFTLRGLLGSIRWATGMAVSVLLFAITHAYQGLIGILDVGIFGLILAMLYLRRGNLLAPILAHGVNDTLLFIGLYLLV